MPLASLDEIVSANKVPVLFGKTAGLPTVAANTWTSYFAATGFGTSAPANLTLATAADGAKPNGTTPGAMWLIEPPTPTYKWQLLSATMHANVLGMALIYDRVWHGGSYTPVSGAYSFTETPDMTEYGGLGYTLFVEVATAISAAAHTLTIVLRHNDGSTSTNTVVINASSPVGRMIPVPIVSTAPRDIKNIVSISGSASPPTGTFNLVLARPIFSFAVVAATAAVLADMVVTGMQIVEPDACLAVAFFNPTGTTAPLITGALVFAEGAP